MLHLIRLMILSPFPIKCGTHKKVSQSIQTSSLFNNWQKFQWHHLSSIPHKVMIAWHIPCKSQKNPLLSCLEIKAFWVKRCPRAKQHWLLLQIEEGEHANWMWQPSPDNLRMTQKKDPCQTLLCSTIHIVPFSHMILVKPFNLKILVKPCCSTTLVNPEQFNFSLALRAPTHMQNLRTSSSNFSRILLVNDEVDVIFPIFFSWMMKWTSSFLYSSRKWWSFSTSPGVSGRRNEHMNWVRPMMLYLKPSSWSLLLIRQIDAFGLERAGTITHSWHKDWSHHTSKLLFLDIVPSASIRVPGASIRAPSS